MLKDTRIEFKTTAGGAPRPCAFYHAAMPSADARRTAADSGTSDMPTGLSHRCILNPGRLAGPDGEEIGPLICTLSRQSECQTHRRKKMARLHATLPITRIQETVQA